MINKQWLVKTFVGPQDRLRAQKLSIQPETAALLRLRGASTPEDMSKFIRGDLKESLPDPFTFKMMAKAVDLLKEVLERQSRVTVYGDYDADGVSATALMLKGLRALGFKNINYFIPNRFDQGYGLNKESLLKIIEDGTALIITVDCGISSVEEAQIIKSFGTSLIITDHHQPSEVLPEADAIINPQIAQETYPFSQLAGVGVAFEVVRALSISLNKTDILDELLPLAALGTVGDVVPLIGVNRALVKEGIKMINEGKSAGIKALMEKSGIKRLTSAIQIAFQIVPKINASGRMANADLALKTLLSYKDEAEVFTDDLDRLNKERKDIEQKIFEEAKTQLKDLDPALGGVLLYDPNWHQGVLGIVASRVCEILEKPVFICTNDNAQIKGSGRAPLGYNLHEILTLSEEYLVRFGGHAQAAGITLEPENIDAFLQLFPKLCELYGKNNSQKNAQGVDLELDFDVDLTLLNEEWKLFEPLGSQNEEPLVLLRGAEVTQARSISEGAHLQLNFQFGNRRYLGFAWRKGQHLDQFSGMMDLLVKLQSNVYRGVESLRLEIIDWRESFVFDFSLMKALRESEGLGNYYFHSPISLLLLQESGFGFNHELTLKVEGAFPFLPKEQWFGHESQKKDYLLDPPLSLGHDSTKLYHVGFEFNWAQTLNWMLPNREHLTIWYRWLKGEGLNRQENQLSSPYPGGLDDFYAEIALSNVLHLFLQAGLIELSQNDFYWLETEGKKIDLELLPEFQKLQNKRKELLSYIF